MSGVSAKPRGLSRGSMKSISRCMRDRATCTARAARAKAESIKQSRFILWVCRSCLEVPVCKQKRAHNESTLHPRGERGEDERGSCRRASAAECLTLILNHPPGNSPPNSAAAICSDKMANQIIPKDQEPRAFASGLSGLEQTPLDSF